MTTDELYTLIDADIKSRLSDFRYHHSVCVSQAAEKLALMYNADPVKARLAGIGHDVLKELSKDEFLSFFNENGIELSSIEKTAPKLWHAIAGAYYLKQKYNLDDDIISAVRFHTTGKAEMNLLEKIIYTADFISDDRDYNGVDKMREYAHESIEKAMAEGLRFTVEELSSKGVPIHPDTFLAYNEIILGSMNNE